MRKRGSIIEVVFHRWEERKVNTLVYSVISLDTVCILKHQFAKMDK
jgi:hypothetical protein